MRKSLYAFAFAGLTLLCGAALSSCAPKPPSPQGSMMDDALAAYVKGDFNAFDAIEAKAEAAAEPGKAVPDYDNACTAAATDARRAIALATELHGLDVSPVFSMSDEARYVFLSADLTDASRMLAHSGNRKGCEAADGRVFYGDVDERQSWISAMYKATHDWQVTLRQKSPADFERRLQDARDQLERNHMGHFVEMRSGY